MRQTIPRELDKEIELAHREGKRVEAEFLLRAIVEHSPMGETEALIVARQLAPLYAEELAQIVTEIQDRFCSLVRSSCHHTISCTQSRLRELGEPRPDEVTVAKLVVHEPDAVSGYLKHFYVLSDAVLILEWAIKQPARVNEVCY